MPGVLQLLPGHWDATVHGAPPFVPPPPPELSMSPAVIAPSLVRSADIPHLVGDSTKLRRATGWAPTISLDRTLQELVDAQAD